MKKTIILIVFACLCAVRLSGQPGRELLNTGWEVGYDRVYDTLTDLPAVYGDGAQMSPSAVWYRKEVSLPGGDWTHARLELKGARFSPAVYVDSVLQERKAGGMAPLSFDLGSRARPGQKIVVEIELQSMNNIPQTDASYIPVADQWRSNIASYIWDDIVLHVHGDSRISRYVPHTDIDQGLLRVDFETETPGMIPADAIRCQVIDEKGRVVMSTEENVRGHTGTLILPIDPEIQRWSPETPHLYTVRLELLAGGRIVDSYTSSLGFKSFEVCGKQFYLNGSHYPVRAGSVVWHRWVRNPEGQELGWDTDWFEKNIVTRLKEHGANTLRFHLGNPPERILDLCDRHGLLVQYEWSFFHGMNATAESLFPQWRSWLDHAMRHPSVSLIHPYNETSPEELITAWEVLDELLKEYPPLVLEDRDVIHVHKYWWSLFENLGLYYDSYSQFDKAIMVDEFGGNYLDGVLEPGGYPALKESYLRFLGENHTPAMRENHLNQSNARVAEYWRRTGAAGFSPFVILSSWEDGNHWFMGDLGQGNPKTVWNALTASYSPRSVSLELWDRNFEPGHELNFSLYLFNDTAEKSAFPVRITLKDISGQVVAQTSCGKTIPARCREVMPVTLQLPQTEGEFLLEAELTERPAGIRYPVVSQWQIRTLRPEVPASIRSRLIGLTGTDTPLHRVLEAYGLRTADPADPRCGLLLLARQDWERIEQQDQQLLQTVQRMIDNGKPVIFTDVGPIRLGQGYPEDKNDLGPLQAVARLENGKMYTVPLTGDIRAVFREMAEPESHIQVDRLSETLAYKLPPAAHWMWNGLRGGLIVPAAVMSIEGADAAGYVRQWTGRGADAEKITSGSPYYGYELEGYYAYSDTPDDRQTIDRLRERVYFLVEDAPALAISVNPHAPITQTDLLQGYRKALQGGSRIETLARAGKNLTAEPIVWIRLENGGSLLLSQAIMRGRLEKTNAGSLYDLRYDPAALQLLFNLMELVITNEK